MLVTLYTSRVILNTLGVVDFGIFNVVGGVVVMFGFLNTSMSSATQRFLSYEIGRGDFVQLRKTFNATQIIHIGIAILIFIFAETVGLWFVKTYLIIPLDRMEAAIWVYHFSVLSFMVTVIQVPYNATIIAHERMNVYAYVSILEVILKLLIVFMLTWITYDKLKLYGILHFAVVFVIAAIYRIYTRRNFEESKFQVVKDKKLYKTLISFSGWSIYGSGLALMASNQGVNILLNFFFGPVVNAARSIAFQINSAIYTFVSNFQVAVKPQIIKSYANNEHNYMYALVFNSSKYSFFLLFLLSLPVIMEIEIVLKIWLDIVPDYAVLFSKLVLINALIDCLSSPIVTAVQATGKIKKYQLIVGTILILVLPISYFFLKISNNPAIPFYLNICVSFILLFTRLKLWSGLVDFSVWSYVSKLFVTITPIAFFPTLASMLFISNFESSVFRLIVNSALCIVTTVISIYFFGLNKKEKKFLKDKIASYL